MKFGTSFLCFLQCNLIDDSGFYINLKTGLEEERNIIEGKSENKNSKFMFNK